MTQTRLRALFAASLAWMALAGPSQGAKVSDVRGTRHNLSVTGTGAVRATTETQVCVFCHTPHGVTLDGSPLAPVTPLWNRRLSNETYTVYTSSTLDANVIQGQLDQPGGSSKLCLSCHDGTLAIGQVNVLNGQGSFTTPGTVSVSLTGTDTDSGGDPKDVVGGMPDHLGKTSGFTRDLGIDLRNDHPISVTFTTELANRDGELRLVDAAQKWPADGSIIGVRASGYRPALPLEATGALGKGQVQCGTCHDPHLRETAEATAGNQKFLRQNRFQASSGPTGTYNAATDIICISCHDKNGNFGSWAYSAHAVPTVANESYQSGPASTRDFPGAIQVWQASCMNCHDTHAVQGTRRLLREGTDGPISNGVRQGGDPALEETCYQCHSSSGESILSANTTVPDIKTDFTTAGNKRMPITGTEVHDISSNFNDGIIDCTGIANTQQCGKDFLEPRTQLGHAGNLVNRHAECTDCHNPHRVIKYQNGLPGALSGLTFNDSGLSRAGTHRHEDTTGYVHSNLISGVLRGSWGVEPDVTSYSPVNVNTTPAQTSRSFHSIPTNFFLKRGDPGNSTSTLASATYVTREYQICLKCHSNYGYDDNNLFDASSNRPALGSAGLTAQNANGHANFTRYTNQAKEFQAPSAHAIQVGSANLGTDGGAANTTAANTRNHRSWHPVIAPTGRTSRAAGGFRAPWNNAGALGNQTMYCSDCHGSDTGNQSAMPAGNTNTNENGNPWGPHGSATNFLLKGPYDTCTGTNTNLGSCGNSNGRATTQNDLCFKCHNYNSYANGGGGTGFDTDKGDGHAVHYDRIRPGGNRGIRCNWCHVAVPHGFKNRNLLANVNDVGPEAGFATTGNSPAYTNNVGYTNGPYYRRAFLRVTSFAVSGNWSDTNCNGGRDGMRNNCPNPP